MNSTFPKTPTNKFLKAAILARYWSILGPIPDGCTVKIVVCDCPIQHCECEIELELRCDRCDSLGPCLNPGTVGISQRGDQCLRCPGRTINTGGICTRCLNAGRLPCRWFNHLDFADRMTEFLLAVDPTNYAERFIDPSPIMVLSMDRRLEAMARRMEQGFVTKNPNDLDASLLKVGEDSARGRNGSTYSLGLEGADKDDEAA